MVESLNKPIKCLMGMLMSWWMLNLSGWLIYLRGYYSLESQIVGWLSVLMFSVCVKKLWEEADREIKRLSEFPKSQG